MIHTHYVQTQVPRLAYLVSCSSTELIHVTAAAAKPTYPADKFGEMLRTCVLAFSANSSSSHQAEHVISFF